MKSYDRLAMLDFCGTLVSEDIEGDSRGPRHPDEVDPLPTVFQGIKKLRDEGYAIAVVSNRADVGRGLVSMDELCAVHSRFNALLAAFGLQHVDLYLVCPHKPEDACNCRKPKPGMFAQAMDEFNVATGLCLALGNDGKDVEAARKVLKWWQTGLVCAAMPFAIAVGEVVNRVESKWASKA